MRVPRSPSQMPPEWPPNGNRLCVDQSERVWSSRMGSILVRGLDQKTIERLKERARLNGRSLQQDVKEILERASG